MKSQLEHEEKTNSIRSFEATERDYQQYTVSDDGIEPVKTVTSLTIFDLELEIVEEKYNPETNQIEWCNTKSNSTVVNNPYSDKKIYHNSIHSTSLSNDRRTLQSNGTNNDDDGGGNSKDCIKTARSLSGTLSMTAPETAFRTTFSDERDHDRDYKKATGKGKGKGKAGKDKSSRFGKGVSGAIGYEDDVTHRSRHLKRQIGGFSIKLRKDDNILTQLCPKFAKFIMQDKVMLTLVFILIVGEIFDWCYNDIFLRSISLSSLVKLYIAVATLLGILYMNTYIIKQALQTFIVWYKITYIAWGIIARMIYLKFYIPKTGNLYKNNTDTKNYAISKFEYNLNAALLFADFILLMLLGTIGDGYVSPNGVKSNIGRRSLMIVSIMLLIWYYIDTLFNITDGNYDKDEKFTINLFGKKDSFYWQNIAASSFFTGIMFTGTQLYRNIAHPYRLNFIPLSVTIKQTSLKLMNYENASDKGLYWQNAANSINFKIGHGNNINRRQMDSEKNLAKYLATTLDVETNEFIVTIPCERTIFYIILQRVFKLPNKKCCDYSENLLRGKRFKRLYKVLVFMILVSICAYWLMFAYYISFGLLLMCNLFWMFCLCMFLINFNYTLVYYKRKSWTLIWKCYDITIFFVSLYLIRWHHKIDQFSSDFSISESILLSVCTIICWIILTFCLTIHQAHFGFSKRWKIFLVLAYILHIDYYVVVFYLNGSFINYRDNELEYEIKILGLTIRCRSLVLSSGIDLSLWFLHQLYKIIKDPMKIDLVSKVQIQWID